MFELAKTLPNHGIGSTFTKYSWRVNAEAYPETYWKLTRIVPRPSGRSGKAWGILTWKGRPRFEEGLVNGSMKPIWAVKVAARETTELPPGPKLPEPPASEGKSL